MTGESHNKYKNPPIRDPSQAQRSQSTTRDPRKNDGVINWVKNNWLPYDCYYKTLTVFQTTRRVK